MRDKFRELRIAWKAILLVTPYIRVKRGCAGIEVHNLYTAWRAVHRERLCMKANQVQPSRLTVGSGSFYLRASSPSSSMHLGYSWYCLPGNLGNSETYIFSEYGINEIRAIQQRI